VVGPARRRRDRCLRNETGGGAGAPLVTPWTKRYGFGLVPIGDAFVAWSKTARPWVSPTPPAPPAAISGWWRVPLLILGAIAVAPWTPALARAVVRRRARRRTVRPRPAD
jgi:hypothetical protein